MRAAVERVGTVRGLKALPPARSARSGFRSRAPRATLTHGTLTAGTARGLASAAVNGGLLKGQWGPAVLHMAAGGLLGAARWCRDRGWALEGRNPACSLPAAGSSGAGGWRVGCRRSWRLSGLLAPYHNCPCCWRPRHADHVHCSFWLQPASWQATRGGRAPARPPGSRWPASSPSPPRSVSCLLSWPVVGVVWQTHTHVNPAPLQLAAGRQLAAGSGGPCGRPSVHCLLR